jgi:hypothetical protein
MSHDIGVAHDPSAPAGHLPGFAREETSAAAQSGFALCPPYWWGRLLPVTTYDRDQLDPGAYV